MPLQQERILSESRLSKRVAHTIGRFGLPLDSSASAYVPSKNPFSRPASAYRSALMSPSDMTNDAAHIGCVLALETTMDEMKSQNKATHHLLQSVLDRLGPSQAQNAPDRI